MRIMPFKSDAVLEAMSIEERNTYLQTLKDDFDAEERREMADLTFADEKRIAAAEFARI